MSGKVGKRLERELLPRETAGPVEAAVSEHDEHDEQHAEHDQGLDISELGKLLMDAFFGNKTTIFGGAGSSSDEDSPVEADIAGDSPPSEEDSSPPEPDHEDEQHQHHVDVDVHADPPAPAPAPPPSPPPPPPPAPSPPERPNINRAEEKTINRADKHRGPVQVVTVLGDENRKRADRERRPRKRDRRPVRTRRREREDPLPGAFLPVQIFTAARGSCGVSSRRGSTSAIVCGKRRRPYTFHAKFRPAENTFTITFRAQGHWCRAVPGGRRRGTDSHRGFRRQEAGGFRCDSHREEEAAQFLLSRTEGVDGGRKKWTLRYQGNPLGPSRMVLRPSLELAMF